MLEKIPSDMVPPLDIWDQNSGIRRCLTCLITRFRRQHPDTDLPFVYPKLDLRTLAELFFQAVLLKELEGDEQPLRPYLLGSLSLDRRNVALFSSQSRIRCIELGWSDPKFFQDCFERLSFTQSLIKPVSAGHIHTRHVAPFLLVPYKSGRSIGVNMSHEFHCGPMLYGPNES